MGYVYHIKYDVTTLRVSRRQPEHKAKLKPNVTIKEARIKDNKDTVKRFELSIPNYHLGLV